MNRDSRLFAESGGPLYCQRLFLRGLVESNPLARLPFRGSERHRPCCWTRVNSTQLSELLALHIDFRIPQPPLLTVLPRQ